MVKSTETEDEEEEMIDAIRPLILLRLPTVPEKLVKGFDLKPLTKYANLKCLFYIVVLPSFCTDSQYLKKKDGGFVRGLDPQHVGRHPKQRDLPSQPTDGPFRHLQHGTLLDCSSHLVLE